ncbi:hypothetical protein BC629DRAFT_1623074 [Irpex lacteus]|nr:hypothetical protein BC629DRAFT_1623074 [Irpex lacteus]
MSSSSSSPSSGSFDSMLANFTLLFLDQGAPISGMADYHSQLRLAADDDQRGRGALHQASHNKRVWVDQGQWQYTNSLALFSHHEKRRTRATRLGWAGVGIRRKMSAGKALATQIAVNRRSLTELFVNRRIAGAGRGDATRVTDQIPSHRRRQTP